MVGAAESANAMLQQTARSTMALAKPNFERFQLPLLDFWDCAVRHGAVQKRWLRRMLRGEATYEQAERGVGAPYSAIGEVGLMVTGPVRKAAPSKQFADRMVSALFLGMTTDGRYIMVEANGQIHKTMHVRFGIDAMPAGPMAATGAPASNASEQGGTRINTAASDTGDDKPGTGNDGTDTGTDSSTSTSTDTEAHEGELIVFSEDGEKGDPGGGNHGGGHRRRPRRRRHARHWDRQRRHSPEGRQRPTAPTPREQRRIPTPRGE